MVLRASSHLSLASFASANTLVDDEAPEADLLLARSGSRFEWSLKTHGSTTHVAPPFTHEVDPKSPWKQLAAVFALTAVQPLCFELIFPFVNQMILENGIVNKPEEVGFYTGVVESVFQITGIIAILPCSWISNRYGRKPVVVFGTFGMSISIAAFGMAKSYWLMVVCRCIGGTLGGTIAACKVMTMELFKHDKARVVRALCLWTVSFRIGQIIGQPLGGLLSHPARTMPFFDSPFWREYPFSLPCFAASIFAFSATVLAIVALPETLQKRDDIRRLTPISEEPDTPQSSLKATFAVLDTNSILILLSLFVVAFTSEMIFVIYPIFGFTPLGSGGLGLTEPQIGAHMGVRGVMNILTLMLYTPFAADLDALKVYKLTVWFWPLSMAVIPTLNLLARSGGERVGSTTFYLVLLVFFFLWSLAQLVWTSSQVVTNEIASNPEMLANINGLAQIIFNVSAAIVPSMITSLFAYSIENHALGGYMVYVVMLIIGVSAALLCMILKDPAKVKRAGYEPLNTGLQH